MKFNTRALELVLQLFKLTQLNYKLLCRQTSQIHLQFSNFFLKTQIKTK